MGTPAWEDLLGRQNRQGFLLGRAAQEALMGIVLVYVVVDGVLRNVVDALVGAVDTLDGTVVDGVVDTLGGTVVDTQYQQVGWDCGLAGVDWYLGVPYSSVTQDGHLDSTVCYWMWAHQVSSVIGTQVCSVTNSNPSARLLGEIPAPLLLRPPAHKTPVLGRVRGLSMAHTSQSGNLTWPHGNCWGGSICSRSTGMRYPS